MIRVAVLSLGSASCSMTPKQTLAHFLREVDRQDYSAAYARMTPTFRQTCDVACFVRMVSSRAEANRLLLGELSAPKVTTGRKVQVTLHTDLPPLALQTLADGRVSPRAKPEFFFADNPLDFYPQATPEQALRSFVRAFRLQRFDVLLRLMPKTHAERFAPQTLREHFSAQPQIAVQVEALRAQLHKPVTVDGNTARLILGPEQETTLVSEDGRWKIQKLQ